MASNDAQTPISSPELVEKLKNPLWAKELMDDMDHFFAEPYALLKSTVMSANHEEEDHNVEEHDVKPMNMQVILERAAKRGLDTFVAMNNFCKNRLLYRGWWDEQEQVIYWLARFGPGSVGPPGGAHGGALAAVLDQFAGYAAIPLSWCVTGELKVTYKSLVPLEEVVFIESRITKTEGRKMTVSMSIHSLPVFCSDLIVLKTAEAGGASVRKLKKPVNGHTHYYIPPAKTTSEALMIKIPHYRDTAPLSKLPPGFSAAWVLGFELPKAKL
jgi:hypothetical protein